MKQSRSRKHKCPMVALDWESPNAKEVIRFANQIGAHITPNAGKLKGIRFFCVRLPWEHKARLYSRSVVQTYLSQDNFAYQLSLRHQ